MKHTLVFSGLMRASITQRLFYTTGLALLFMAATATISSPAYAADAEAGDVFSDAVFWFSGAYDDNGNGCFDTGDFRDVRHIDDASHWLNQGVKNGYSNTHIAITNMPVVHPHACFTNANEKCLNFLQPLDEVDSSKIKATGIRLPTLFPVCYQSNLTAVIRFRWAGRTRENGNTYLVSLGFGDNSSPGGLALGIDNPTGNLKAYYRSGGTQVLSSSSSLAIHSNVWADVAIVIDSGTVKVYRIMEDYYMDRGQWHIYQTSLPAAAVADTTSAGTRFAIGNNGENLPTFAATTSSGYAWNVFRGQVQQVAIWNRALSAHEVAEAFGCQSDKLRFGVPDGGSGEFAGTTRNGAPAKPEDWRDFASLLTSADPSLTLRFTLGAHEAGLAQTLGVLSTPYSSAGDMAIQVNGQSVGNLRISPGRFKSIFIPKNLTVSGENTLTLTWQESGTCSIDALTLGGSWQIGLEDSSTSGFHKRDQYLKTYYAFGPQTWSRFNNGVSSDTNYEDNTMVFMLSEASAAGEHTLKVPVICSTQGTDPLKVRVSVNGTVKDVVDVTTRDWSSPQIVNLRLADGELNAGANTIEFRNIHETTGTAVVYDYVRLTARPPRGSTCLVIR